jgi:hypothetical protein
MATASFKLPTVNTRELQVYCNWEVLLVLTLATIAKYSALMLNWDNNVLIRYNDLPDDDPNQGPVKKSDAQGLMDTILLNCLTKEMELAVRANPGFPTAYIAGNFFALKNMIRQTYAGFVQQVAEARSVEFNKLSSISMGMGSIIAYTKNARELIRSNQQLEQIYIQCLIFNGNQNIPVAKNWDTDDEVRATIIRGIDQAELQYLRTELKMKISIGNSSIGDVISFIEMAAGSIRLQQLQQPPTVTETAMHIEMEGLKAQLATQSSQLATLQEERNYAVMVDHERKRRNDNQKAKPSKQYGKRPKLS